MSRQLENQNAPGANSRGKAGTWEDEFMTKIFLATCVVRTIVGGAGGSGYDIIVLDADE